MGTAALGFPPGEAWLFLSHKFIRATSQLNTGTDPLVPAFFFVILSEVSERGARGKVVEGSLPFTTNADTRR
ncbi:MAG: hypothetical protein WCB59_16665 [Candidatus Sulfotelmatobacter sp.]